MADGFAGVKGRLETAGGPVEIHRLDSVRGFHDVEAGGLEEHSRHVPHHGLVVHHEEGAAPGEAVLGGSDRRAHPHRLLRRRKDDFERGPLSGRALDG